MKKLRCALSVGAVLTLVLAGHTAGAAQTPERVAWTFEGALRVVVSASGTPYVRGGPAGFTMTMTDESKTDSYPVRWRCHQFAHLRFVSVDTVLSQPSQDLGPAPMVDKPAQCGSSTGIIHPGERWTTHQTVPLRHPHVAPRLVLVRKRVDEPGSFGMVVYMPVLNFSLVRSGSK